MGGGGLRLLVSGQVAGRALLSGQLVLSSALRGPGDASLRGCGARGVGEGACSPLPDYPGTPPHKTFRKLRLFDTPHTPKVRGRGRRGAQSPRRPSLLKRPRRRERSAALPGFGYITARPHPSSLSGAVTKKLAVFFLGPAQQLSVKIM